MAPIRTMRNILMELRKVCQHPYLSAPEFEKLDVSEEQQQRNLINGSGKLMFLKLLLPKLKQRGHRVLLFSQFKIALDRIEDFLYGEGYKFLRLDGDVQQAARQKSMDAFNAEDSDYFIFLLTTRAGGVGINLATADTVIIFDPDFNPHMDLQAIARSHRYGQKKKVLVFKLMTKNSVEEKIIWAGKKKMVLDHLVVQQMGKENEEGDIDNMLLHGAKALYEADAEGNAPTDIHYTSKNVDELIDKVQQEAEAKAKAEEEAEVGGNDRIAAAAGTESMSFAFAKIWETGKNDLEEVPEEIEDGVQDWQDVQEVMKNVEAEKLRLQQYRANGGVDLLNLPVKRMRKTVNGRYTVEGGQSDESPSQSKNVKKGKGKQKNIETSDPDFAASAQSESDDDSGASDVDDIGDLFDSEGRHITGFVDLQHGSKTLKKRHLLTQTALEMPSGTTSPTKKDSSSTRAGRENETPEQKAARKAARREQKAAKKKQREVERVAEMRRRARGEGLNPQSTAIPQVQSLSTSSNTQNLSTQGTSNVSRPPPMIQQHRINEGRAVVQWLYAVLKDFGLSQHNQGWATMCLPELPIDERKNLYRALSRIVDEQLYVRRQDPYFTKPQQETSAFIWIDSGTAVLPPDPGSKRPPAIPATSFSTGRGGGYSRAKLAAGGVAAREPPERGHVWVDTPRAELLRTEAPLAETPSIVAARAEIPTVGNTLVRPPAGTAASVPSVIANVQPVIAEPPSIAALPAIQSPSPAYTPVPRQQRTPCEFCANQHDGLCPEIAPLDDLYLFRDEIKNSNEPEADKQRGMALLNRMIEAHRKAAGSVNRANGHSASGSEAAAPATGSRDAAIVIDDSGDDEAPPAFLPTPVPARSASNPVPTAVSQPQHPIVSPRQIIKSSQPRRRTGGVDTRCGICNSRFYHSANDCPIVRAGPESIVLALRRFPDPADPMHQILHQHYVSKLTARADPVPLCAFCLEPCGMTIRLCVENRGGRKKLKDRIRVLEGLIQNGDTDPNTSKILEALFEAYRMWPKHQSA